MADGSALRTARAYDRLEVIHSLRLAGTFAVSLTGQAPDEGQAYDVLDAGTFIDEGYVLDLPQLAPELEWDASDFESEGILRVIGDTCQADINDDGLLDFDDLILVLGNWGSDDPWIDIDDNGVVDFGDLVMVLSHWGSC